MAPPSSISFVQSVWNQIGATGPTDFARRLGLGPDGLQKVRRWRRGGRLDYEDVMRMLEVTGWFSPGRPAADGQPAPTIPDSRLEELADAVAELLDGQQEILALLRRERRRRTA